MKEPDSTALWSCWLPASSPESWWPSSHRPLNPARSLLCRYSIISMCIYIYTHTYTYVYAYVYVYMYVYVCMYSEQYAAVWGLDSLYDYGPTINYEMVLVRLQMILVVL